MEGRLEHHVGARTEGLEGVVRRSIQFRGLARVHPRDLDNLLRRPIGREHARLVLVAEGAGALEHGVGGDIDTENAAELDVERAHERELALRCRRQVTRARVDDGMPVVGRAQEHACARVSVISKRYREPPTRGTPPPRPPVTSDICTFPNPGNMHFSDLTEAKRHYLRCLTSQPYDLVMIQEQWPSEWLRGVLG